MIYPLPFLPRTKGTSQPKVVSYPCIMVQKEWIVKVELVNVPTSWR